MNAPSPTTEKSEAKASQSKATSASGDGTGCRDYDARPQCDPILTECVEQLDRALHGPRIGRPEQVVNWNGDNITTDVFKLISEQLAKYRPDQRRTSDCLPSSRDVPTGG